MSERRNIIEVTPPAYEKVREFLTFSGYRCPVCSGRGKFTEEIGRDKYETTTCDYCQGVGAVRAEILINWKPDI